MPLCYKPSRKLWVHIGNRWSDLWVGPFDSGKELNAFLELIDLGPMGKIEYLGGMELPRAFDKGYEMCMMERRYKNTIYGALQMWGKK